MGADIVRQPRQTELLYIEGSPEGAFYGPPGFLVVDEISGEIYRKTTLQEYNTGWVILGSGGSFPGSCFQGIFPTSGLPANPPPNPLCWAQAYDQVYDVLYLWIPSLQLWR